MKRTVFIIALFLSCCLKSYSQQALYDIAIRVEHADSVQHCDCQQNYNDNSVITACTMKKQVLINVYSDTSLLQTYYFNYTDNSISFKATKGIYKITLLADGYDKAIFTLDLTASDKMSTVYPVSNCTIHFTNDGTGYFICVLMHGKDKKSGVRIIPK